MNWKRKIKRKSQNKIRGGGEQRNFGGKQIKMGLCLIYKRISFNV